jgi:hypothetical protein
MFIKSLTKEQIAYFEKMGQHVILTVSFITEDNQRYFAEALQIIVDELNDSIDDIERDL